MPVTPASLGRTHRGLEPRLCGSQLATRSSRLFKQVLPDAVEAGDFRRIGFSAPYNRLEIHAQGRSVSPMQQLLKLVRAMIGPLDS